jgi:hypothetical protein
MRIHPADSAGWRLKQCSILSAEPKDISTASVRDLCLFIRGTGLLNLCIEYLGLHNKPKAEVHPGQELTGPKEEEEEEEEEVLDAL